jgi:hypothetical protein
MCARVVLDLMRPYFGTFRTVACDSYYASVFLFKSLFAHDVLAVGTVRANSRLYAKELVDFKLGKDEYEVRRNQAHPSMVAVAHRNADRTKLYLSTATPVGADGKIEDRYVTVGRNRSDGDPTYLVPLAYIQYNMLMGGVDLANQYAARPSLWRQSQCWWTSIFLHFLNMTIVNSWYLYRYYGDASLPSLTLVQFRKLLMVALMGEYNGRERAGRPFAAGPAPASEPELVSAGERLNCVVCFHREGGAGAQSNVGSRTRFVCKRCGKPVCNPVGQRKDSACAATHSCSK